MELTLSNHCTALARICSIPTTELDVSIFPNKILFPSIVSLLICINNNHFCEMISRMMEMELFYNDSLVSFGSLSCIDLFVFLLQWYENLCLAIKRKDDKLFPFLHRHSQKNNAPARQADYCLQRKRDGFQTTSSSSPLLKKGRRLSGAETGRSTFFGTNLSWCLKL